MSRLWHWIVFLNISRQNGTVMAGCHIESVHRQVGVGIVVRYFTARWRLRYAGRVLGHREKSMREPEELRSLKPSPIIWCEVWPLRRYLHWNAHARWYYTYERGRMLLETYSNSFLIRSLLLFIVYLMLSILTLVLKVLYLLYTYM